MATIHDSFEAGHLALLVAKNPLSLAKVLGGFFHVESARRGLPHEQCGRLFLAEWRSSSSSVGIEIGIGEMNTIQRMHRELASAIRF